ncbi:trigger factor [Intestinicryptomonas porci]|uniref:Trigger factor n=1 Tax=Intestinicryptomonas porci TaxID=2926320 RepID=A0ABU4WHH9_9BACT|nr:trigger factor [Opitutales bacterium CLA-KB-P66]
MKTNIEKINDTRRKIVVSFDSSEVAKEKEGVVAEFVQYAKIPGFRAGKAPKDMVLKRFSGDIKAQLERVVTNKAVEALNGIKEFDLFAVVDLQNNDIESSEGAALTFTADIYPEVKLPEDYKTEVELSPVEATEDEIQKTVDFYRNQRAQYNKIEDRAAQKGDFVQVSYEGKIDGKSIDELVEKPAMYGKQKGTWEEAGNTDVPGVRSIIEGVVGMKVGEKKNVEEIFAADFPEAALAGKTAVYELELNEIREKKLPEIDEAFLKDMGDKTEADFRARLAKDITAEKTQHNEVLKRQYAVDKLMEGVDFPLPESALEEERQSVLQEMMMRFMSSGATKEDLEKNKESLFENATKEAEPRAKMRIFLNRVAVANSLKVDNEDMQRMLWQESVRTRTRPEELIKQLKKDQARINRMRSDALLQKAINFIAEKAEVKIVEKK